MHQNFAPINYVAGGRGLPGGAPSFSLPVQLATGDVVSYIGNVLALSLGLRMVG